MLTFLMILGVMGGCSLYSEHEYGASLNENCYVKQIPGSWVQ